jgi:hypothetical protein
MLPNPSLDSLQSRNETDKSGDEVIGENQVTGGNQVTVTGGLTLGL